MLKTVRFSGFAGILAGLSLALAACGSGGGDGGQEVAPSPTRAPPAVDLSRDDLGRAVNVPRLATRVAAMSPSIVELLYAVGAEPVVRPSSATYPAQALNVPDFGRSYAPSYEAIVAARPDLIIADAAIHKDTVNDLARLGVPVFAMRVTSFDDVLKGLRVVGALTGNAERGEREAQALQKKLDDILAKKPPQGPTVLVVVGGGPTQLFAGLNNSYAADVIRRLGGRNILTTEPETYSLPGFTEYSLERIVEKNPDVIVAITPGPPNVPRTTDGLGRSPVWSSLKAVREGRVHEVDPVVYLEAAGPRVSLMLDELARILYPDAFRAAR